jgi:REP element-mobilizing transposase RayT
MVRGMARKLRIQYPGAIYHVTVRGVERRRLFRDDRDREGFLRRLGEAVEEYDARLYLFCLMGNHVHLLVETPRANLSAFMHKLQTAYTVYFNLRHGRRGHLMQGRFGAEPVQGDEYLLKLSRYIHLNPVFVAAIRKQPLEVRRKWLRSYPWSSYRGYAGWGEASEFVEERPILDMMAPTARKARRAYQRFVEGGVAETDEEFRQLLRESKWGIGEGAFQDRIRDLHTDRVCEMRRTEDASFRRESPAVSAGVVLDAVAGEFGVQAGFLRRRQYSCAGRAVAAQLLGRYAGMNQRDAAAFLGMGTGSAACRQLKRLRARLADDRSLAQRLKRIGTILDGWRDT